jgi:hypothetical protein
MFRLFVALLMSASTIPLMAQDPKPKSLPRIAIDDPEKLKDDVDFAMQGEFVGQSADGKRKTGMQFIAMGEGNFNAVVYEGGLPGDGWDGKPTPETFKVVKNGGGNELVMEGEVMAKIKDGSFLSTKRGFPLKKLTRTSPTIGAKPPAGADVLFGEAGDEKNWAGGKLVSLSDGKFLNNGIKSVKKFGSFTAHVEFRLPWMPNSRGQGRGNSGFYLQDRYEIQVLDSFGLKGENNECGGVYTLAKPKVNMCLPPMTWQTYDIDFTAAVYAEGKKTKNARLTLKHNGMLVHDDVELKNATGGGQPEADSPGPIQLQNHGDPVVYRNIWVAGK